jgi:hypothetical protein
MGHWNSSCDQKILFILSLDLSVARFVSVRLSFDFRVGAFSFSVALAMRFRFTRCESLVRASGVVANSLGPLPWFSRASESSHPQTWEAHGLPPPRSSWGFPGPSGLQSANVEKSCYALLSSPLLRFDATSASFPYLGRLPTRVPRRP